jgi:hypothetical protein
MSAQDAHKRKSDRSSDNGRPPRERKTRGLADAVRAAMDQFATLTGRTPESVTGAKSLEDGAGWSVLVDVVELDRIPASTSVLATYRVDLDPEGSITSYERLRRYTRGATDPT